MNALIPHPSDFVHGNRTHGQGHVARVMVHAFRLIEATGLVDEGSRLWGAVYLHDIARTHDGFDEVHGMHAVMRVNESTDLQERLIAHGVQSDDPSMLLAVMMHCLPDDHSAYGGKPIWPLLALLKDADGLDRVRMGDLEPAYFRNQAAKDMVQFAQDLYSQTRRIKEGPNHFSDVVRVAEKLLGKQIPIPPTVLASAAMKGRRVLEPSPQVIKPGSKLAGKPGTKGAVPAAQVKSAKGAAAKGVPAKGVPAKSVSAKGAPAKDAPATKAVAATRAAARTPPPRVKVAARPGKPKPKRRATATR